MSGSYKSKTLAAWLAVVGGALGLHRLYLHGFSDKLGWAHLVPTAIGAIGVLRMRDLGQDDRLSWLLIPIFGLMIAQGMLHAIIYGLTADERWDARHNPGATVHPTRWGPILAVITALLVGAAVLMGTIAFGGQKFFEWQLEPRDPVALRSPGYAFNPLAGNGGKQRLQLSGARDLQLRLEL